MLDFDREGYSIPFFIELHTGVKENNSGKMAAIRLLNNRLQNQVITNCQKKYF